MNEINILTLIRRKRAAMTRCDIGLFIALQSANYNNFIWLMILIH